MNSQPIETTHSEWGAGRPRFRITRDDDRAEYLIESDLVRIGSDAKNELALDDTDPLHATVTHDERDEYVLTLHGKGEMSASPAVNEQPGDDTAILRTGFRFTVGPWEIVFARDENADHGRPYGGREGGEYSDQRLQPPRPEY